jgi:hypothetical protein
MERMEDCVRKEVKGTGQKGMGKCLRRGQDQNWTAGPLIVVVVIEVVVVV